MVKTLLGAAAMLFVGIPFAQDVGTVDLTRTSRSSNGEAETAHSGCAEFSGGVIAEGSALRSNRGEPHKLLVEFTRVPSDRLILGSTVDAEVRMTNTDTRLIEIPWSTDIGIIPRNQDPAHAEWEVGSFWFELSDTGLHRIFLKSMSRYLYGTKFSPGTELAIRPGESVRALVQFKVDALYANSRPQLQEGKWKLAVEWQQYGISSSLEGCPKATGYTDNAPSGYYREQSPPVPIEIVSGPADN
jgi:hypothetical protein